jgi:hypothetical protein
MKERDGTVRRKVRRGGKERQAGGGAKRRGGEGLSTNPRDLAVVHHVDAAISGHQLHEREFSRVSFWKGKSKCAARATGLSRRAVHCDPDLLDEDCGIRSKEGIFGC